MSSRISRFTAIAVSTVLCAAGSVLAGSPTTIYFDSSNQGGSNNHGPFFNPMNDAGLMSSITVTARTSILAVDPFDAFAPGISGSIAISGDGGGVQEMDGNGSDQISGQNEDAIEELIITFDQAVSTTALYLTISNYNPGSGFGSGDDPLVFVFLRDGTVVSFDETSGIIDESGSLGTVDLGALLDPGAQVESIRVREMRKHITLDSLTFMEVPAPGSLALLATAGVLTRRRRRRRNN